MIVALTGSIGSGKSVVSALLQQRGHTVFDCDRCAEHLLATSLPLQQALSAAVGEDLFATGSLDKRRLAQFILADEEQAQRVNSIVHPAVAAAFRQSAMEWVESAILFESDFVKRILPTFVVCVYAKDTTCIRRIMLRDGVSAEQAQAWLARQMPQEEKCRRADFVINNDDNHDLGRQIDRLLAKLYHPQHP